MSTLSEETIRSLISWSIKTGGPTGAHITRFSMYKALAGYLEPHDDPAKLALCISGSTNLARNILGLRQARIQEAGYPSCNILDLPFEAESFDYCVTDQVLEHVAGEPTQAFRESVRVVRPGGIVCHTTCFINDIHAAPGDYWRFTPDALALMAERAGATTLLVGGWGNREAWALAELGFRFDGIPKDEAHPLHQLATQNEPAWPITVWIVAQRPLPPAP